MPLMLLTFAVGQMWATDATSNFSNSSLAVGTGEPTWATTVNATGFESASYARGVTWGSGGDPVLTSSTITGTITKVTVVASTNAGASKVSLSVSVGSTSFSPASTYVTSGTSDCNSPYEFTGSATGTVTVSLTNSNNSKTAWIKSITITYSSGSSKTLSSISVQTAPKIKYLAGEMFDPTGLVITRTYSDATSDTYAYAGHTSDFTFSPTTSTALTTSNTSVSITYGGKSTSQAINVYNVTMQARDEEGNTIPAGGPGAPSRTGNSISPAADANNYVFKEWQKTNADLGSSATTKANTITNPTGAVTVTAVYYKPITISYKANGQDFTTQTYGYGGTLAFPVSGPNGDTYSCTGKTFTGWVAEANKDYSHASTAPTYVTAGGSVTTGATYYAVFATASGSSKTYSFDITADDFNTTSYSANNNEKTTKATNTSDASDKMDVKWTSNQIYQNGGMQWQKTNGYIYNSTDLGTVNSVTITSTAGGYTTTYGTSENPTTGSQGTGKGYFRVKENGTATGKTSLIRINFTKASYNYSNYETTCCTPLASINGSISWTNGTQATLEWDKLSNVRASTPYVVSVSPNAGVSVGGIDLTGAKATCSVTGLTAGTAYTFTINAYGDATHCDASKEISATAPLITVKNAPVALSGSDYAEGVSGGGEIKTFVVSGVGLTGALTFTAPSNFQVSTDNGYTWSTSGGSKTLDADGTLAETTIKVRLIEGLPKGNYGGATTYVTISGGGAAAINSSVSIAGEVTSSCEAPTVATPTCTSVADGTITVSCASITVGQNCDVDEFGFVWKASSAPTINDNKNTISAAYAADFSKALSIDGFETGTTYYIKAYGHNAGGNALSSALTVTPRKVTFKDGATTLSTAYLNDGEKVAEPEDPSKTGYNFAGWKLNSAAYDFDAEVSSDLELQANWENQNYSITKTFTNCTSSAMPTDYNYTGTANDFSYSIVAAEGYRLPTSITVTMGGDALTLNTDYTWNSTSGALAISVVITGNIVITATAVQVYTITWSANGVETTSTVDVGGKLVLPEDDPATCNGTYGTFIGWYSVAAGSTSTPSNAVSGTKADANHTPSGNETYYAVWGNGALSGDFALVTNVSQLNAGDVVTIASMAGNSEDGTVIKAYNSGNNWPSTTASTDANGMIAASTTNMQTFTLAEGTEEDTWAFYDGTGYIYAANTKTGSSNYMKRQTTLDAAGSFTIEIDGEGVATVVSQGDVNGKNLIQKNSSNALYSCYGSSQKDIYLYKQASAATGFISNCCNSLADINGTVSWSNPTTAMLTWDNVAYVSSWAVKYKKHADANYSDFAGDITGTENKTCTISSLVCGTDYDFQIIATADDGYCDKSQTINDNQVHKYAITSADGGAPTGGIFTVSPESACSGDNVTIEAAANDGYAFNGWTITKASSGTIDPEENIAETTFEMPAEAVTVSAAFSIVNYTITYANMEGATNHVNNPATYTINSAAITLGAPTKDGFDFGGWFTNSDLAPEHAVSTPAIAAGSHENKTFYAKWTQTGTHLVTIADYSNGSVSVTYTGMESALTSGSRTIEENTVLTITATPSEGYEGLLTVNDVDFTSGTTHTLVADITIEAVFAPKSYTISYKDKDGGDYSGSNLASLPDSHTYNTATALVDGVKAGHSFAGWFTDAACTESAGSSLGATAYTDNITLYAKWEEVTMYSVTWMVNGAAYSAGTPTTSVEAGDAITNLPTAPEVCDEDLTFMGWTNAAIEGTQVAAPAVLFTTAGAAPAVTGNVTFYAVFAEEEESTATFNATTLSDLTPGSGLSWTHEGGIVFTINQGSHYTLGTPNTFTVTADKYCGLTSPTGVTIKEVIISLSGASYAAKSVYPGTLETSGTTQTITSVNAEYLYIYATKTAQIRITNIDVKYTPATPTYSNYRTSYTASVPTPVLDVASGKYTSSQVVLVDNYDNDYMYFYTTDGSTPAADENLDAISPAVAYDKDEGIEITSTSTVKVIAYDLCHNASEVTTATYTIAESLTLAEFVEQKPTSNEKVDITGAIVMANDAEYGYIYVQKGEAAMALYYDDEVPAWTVGKQIANGVITGHYDAEDLSMIVTNAGSPTASVDGVLPTPLVINDETAASLMVEANMYRYAQMNSVTLDYDNNSYLNAYSTTSDNSYYYDDWFGVLTSKTLPLSTTECSVKGIITPYTSNEVYHFDQLSPILANDISTNATAVLPTISDLGGADAAHAVEVAEGKEIIITEDANFDAIYQINDGAETAINSSAVVTVTNTAVATKVYVKASRDYYADNSVTYYYIANSALTEHTITCATGLVGGSIAADKSSAVTGATVTLTPSPAEHYHLVAWTVTYNDGEEKTIDVVNNQFEMPGYAVNVTATFAEDAYATVSFAKGAEAATGDVPASQKIYLGEGAHATMPENPFTYAGHNFAGWKYNETTKQAGETYAVTAAGSITFTAQWIANPICTVTLHANGAEDVVEEVVQGATYNMPDAGALVGYTFVGWADAAHNDETTDAIDVVSSFTPEVQAVASTKEFYAVYSRQEGTSRYEKVTSDLGTAWAGDYLIAYSSTIFADGRKGGKDDNGSIGKADVKVDLSTHIVNNTIAAEYGNPYKVTLEEISTNSNTYVLKTQDGKYNYQTTFDNGIVASNNKTTASAYPISVTFTDENDVRLVLGGAAAGVVFRYNTSNRFFRYYKNAGQSAVYLYKYIEAIMYYTTNPAVKYNVSYEVGEGAWRANEGCDASIINAGASYDICEDQPVLENKIFVKWQVSGEDVESPYIVNANTTFTAVYRDAVQYAVNYDANGGVGNAPAATNVLEAADYTILDNSWFFRSGHTFQGWNTAANGSGAAYAADATMAMPSANVTLYAQWQEMPANEKEVFIVAKAGTKYYAMGQTLTTKQFNAIEVAGVKDEKVILPDGFSNENKTAITWHMLTNDNGSTASFYSPANSKYLAQNGNDLALSNDPVDWTWNNETKCYVISGRTFMYRSDYDFRSYSSSSSYSDAVYVTTSFAKAIAAADATEEGLALGDNIVVQDGATLTIGSQQFINDVVVENGGKLTLNANLSVHDLVIHSTLGKGTGTNTSGNAPGNSGQVANGNNLTVNGDVYMELELTQDAAASAGWYAFSVPFPVDAINGVYYGDTKLVNEKGYAIMSHDGALRAKNEYAWKKFRGIMQPGVFYVITVGNTDYKTLRFKKVKDEALVASTSVPVSPFPSEISTTDAAWNGIGNPNLQISNLETAVPKMQFYDHKTNSFIGRDHSVNLVVGSAFFIQYSAGPTVSIPTETNDGHGYLAPKREQNAVENTMYELELTNVTTGEMEDNLSLTAREDATNEYEIGRDLAKMSMGAAKCAKMWVPAYGTQLCVADFPLINNKADYPLTINAPQAGTYSISTVANENADLYLTYEGAIIWNLSMGAYTIDLTKGVNTGYGLLLKAKAPGGATGIENGGMLNGANGVQKLIIDEKVFILRGGKMYGIDGKAVK